MFYESNCYFGGYQLSTAHRFSNPFLQSSVFTIGTFHSPVDMPLVLSLDIVFQLIGLSPVYNSHSMAASDKGNSDARRRDICFITTRVGKRFMLLAGMRLCAKTENEGCFNAAHGVVDALSSFLKKRTGRTTQGFSFATTILTTITQLDAMQRHVETRSTFEYRKSDHSTTRCNGIRRERTSARRLSSDLRFIRRNGEDRVAQKTHRDSLRRGGNGINYSQNGRQCDGRLQFRRADFRSVDNEVRLC